MSKIVTDEHLYALNKEMDFYISNLNVFISVISALNYPNPHDSVKVFLLKYNIDVNEIRDYIDYDKLIRYIEMFNDVVKK